MMKHILPVVVAVAMFALVGVAAGQRPDDSEAPSLHELVDKVIDIRLKDNKIIADATVAEFKEAKLEGSIKTLRVKTPGTKRPVTISAAKIIEIYYHDVPLDVIYDRRNRGIVQSEEKKNARLEHREQVKERLRSSRDRYWEYLSEDDHEKFMEKHRAFLKKTETAMPNIQFQLFETEYFLFLTDLVAAEAQQYIVYLDAMYEEMCMAFGLSPEKNIWCGKCVVVALANKRDFLQFEAAVMNKPDAEGAQGLCHQWKDGTVVFAGYRGENGFFGHVLVHETAHGFVHRYMTTARAPSWLNEGMSDWLADKIVKGDKIPRRRVRSALAISKIGWGDFLTTKRIGAEYYGAASSMVEILVSIDKGEQFKEFFDGIKEGKPADESLKDSFGISYQDLLLMYAEAASRLKK